MSRSPGVYWHKSAGCYATNSGKKENGKRRTIYFPGIPKNNRLAALAALVAYHLGEPTLAAYRTSQHGQTRSDDGPDVRTVVNRYLEHSRATVKPRTAEGHAEILPKFAEFVAASGEPAYGARRARGIRAVDLNRMLRAWEEKGYSPNYRARLVRSVKACWAWAAAADPDRVPEKLIPENTVKDVKGVSIPHSPERYAERSEVATFLRFALRQADKQTPLYRRFGRLTILAVRLTAHTGARPGELCAAQWDDFDPVRKTITLPPERHKTGRKTGKPRVIILSPILVRALLREQARDHHPTYIFTHKRGKGGEGRGASREHGEPWNSRAFGKVISRIRGQAIEAGIPLKDAGPNAFVMYRLRHTQISDAIMKGVPTAVAAAMTGTSERVIAQTYGHIIDSRMHEAAEFLTRARRRGKSK